MEKDDGRTAGARCLERALTAKDQDEARALFRACARYYGKGAALAGETGERRFMPVVGLEITDGRELW